jgi:TonB family protein
MALPLQHGVPAPDPRPFVVPEPGTARKGALRYISQKPEDKLFTALLDRRELNTRSMVASLGVHVAAVILVVLAPLLLTEQLGNFKRRAFVELVAPPAMISPAPPPMKVKLPPPPPPKVVEPAKPKIELPPPPPERIWEAKKIPVTPPEPKFEDAVRPGPVSPAKPAVTVNVFSEGSSAKPTLNLPAKQVQTGGFGDPNGAAGQPIPAKAGNIAQLGSFDLPGGPGYGNGSGGARGARGMVASVGFGNGVASAAGDGGRHSAIRQGSFGDSQPAAEAPRAAPRPKPAESQTAPIEIISKPRPVYTEEARRLKLEGEVLLDVLFGASGQPRVMNITRGLGHGLDEAAVRAAEQIQYRPARRDGQPVDYRATVHIVFQLAY